MAAIYAWLEEFEKWLELVRKVAVSVAVVAGVSLAIFVIARSVWHDGIVIEPVVVHLSDPKDGPTADFAADELGKQIDRIQRAGLGEWRKLSVGEASDPIDLQVPGSPFTVHAGMREIATLLGRKPASIKVSILGAKGKLEGSVAIEGYPQAQATCAGTADGVDSLIECLALDAMSFIDPKVAASYAFSLEEPKCRDLDGNQPGESAVAREQTRIENGRKLCGFPMTQALIAKALARGKDDDLPWVPYIYGKVHVARAAAVLPFDRAAQIGELDQAIARFDEALKLKPDSVSAVAALFGTRVAKGISFHEWTGALRWDDDPKSILQWRLGLAESTFDEALKRLQDAPWIEPWKRTPAYDALVSRTKGVLYYRQWMVQAHRRTRSPMLTVAIGQPRELELLDWANESFAAAARNERSADLYLDWANVLRASGKFDDAVARYVLAADLTPGWYVPRLNLAVAYLDSVIYGPRPADPGRVLLALGSTSSYFAWASEGTPAPNLQTKVDLVLGATGVADDSGKFDECRQTEARTNYIAGRKYCLDQAIKRIADRIASSRATPPAGAAAR